MITISKIHPSGALEVRSLVMGIESRQVWLERQTYYGYTQKEARQRFIRHLADSGFIQKND